MTPASSSSSSSSATSKSPPSPAQPPHHLSTHFTPIQECEHEDERSTPSCTDKGVVATPKHHATPLHHHQNGQPVTTSKSRRSESDSDAGGDDGAVLCNKCRPHAREISAVPLDHNISDKEKSKACGRLGGGVDG